MAGPIGLAPNNPLDGDLRNPVVRLAVQINDLEQQLAYAREQYDLARKQEK